MVEGSLLEVESARSGRLQLCPPRLGSTREARPWDPDWKGKDLALKARGAWVGAWKQWHRTLQMFFPSLPEGIQRPFTYCPVSQ